MIVDNLYPVFWEVCLSWKIMRVLWQMRFLLSTFWIFRVGGEMRRFSTANATLLISKFLPTKVRFKLCEEDRRQQCAKLADRLTTWRSKAWSNQKCGRLKYWLTLMVQLLPKYVRSQTPFKTRSFGSPFAPDQQSKQDSFHFQLPSCHNYTRKSNINYHQLSSNIISTKLWASICQVSWQRQALGWSAVPQIWFSASLMWACLMRTHIKPTLLNSQVQV